MRMRMRMGMPSVLLVLHLSNLVASIKQLPGDTELSCTDDSDCIPLGHKFGCFLYRCGSIMHSSGGCFCHISSYTRCFANMSNLSYITYDNRQINFGRRPLLSIFPLPRCLNYVDSSLSHCQLSSSGPPCDQGDIKIQHLYCKLSLPRWKLLSSPSSERRRFVLPILPPAALLHLLRHLPIHLKQLHKSWPWGMLWTMVLSTRILQVFFAINANQVQHV